MLPSKLKLELFDRLSVKTMRYVTSVPRRMATGLVKEVYDMIDDDFFVNGSLTSHSKVPELLAGVWTGGRESMLVDDHLDRTTKEAMTAVVSQLNECAYCGDMLVSLVHAGRKHGAAKRIFDEQERDLPDATLRKRLLWTKQILTGGSSDAPALPFPRAALPELIASILAISHINRFSHIVMDGSPVSPLLGSKSVKGWSLRMFGHELKSTKRKRLQPDRTAGLLPPAPLPNDMKWASGNPRIAGAMARWAGAIERESSKIASQKTRAFVKKNLDAWDGSPMPLSRSWVEDETADLSGHDRDLARFALITAKSAPQIDGGLVGRIHRSEEQFIRTPGMGLVLRGTPSSRNSLGEGPGSHGGPAPGVKPDRRGRGRILILDACSFRSQRFRDPRVGWSGGPGLHST